MQFWDVFRRKRKQASEEQPAKLDIDSFRLLNPPVRGKHSDRIGESQLERTGVIQYVHKALTTDAIAQRVINRLLELSISNGFRIYSKDRNLDAKLKRRLEEIQLNTGERLYYIIRSLLYEYIAYGNQFAVLVRDSKTTSGKAYRFKGKTLQPIAAIFRQPARFVQIRRKANGEPVEYRVALNEVDEGDERHELIVTQPQQQSNPYQQRFDQLDVVHFVQIPDPDLGGFGRPLILEQLDDLLVLRRLENHLDDIITRGKYYQKYYKVGSENMPPTQAQVQAVKEKLELSDPDETLLVPAPDEVGIEFKDIITPILNAIKEFKNRTYSGLGQSGVQMGEGGQANRQTAEKVIEGLYNTQRDVQQTFAQIFEQQILQQLVLDLGYDPTKLGDQFPRLVFEDPDLERTMRRDQHYALLFTQNVITEDEMRAQLGLAPLSDEDRKKLYANLYGSGKDRTAANLNVVAPQNQHTKSQGGSPNE